MEKNELKDVVEELWTGKIVEVQPGPSFEEFCFRDMLHDEQFRKMILQKLEANQFRIHEQFKDPCKLHEVYAALSSVRYVGRDIDGDALQRLVDSGYFSHWSKLISDFGSDFGNDGVLEFHELLLEVAGVLYNKGCSYRHCRKVWRVGAEFQLADREKRTYHLKMFPVIDTEQGLMRIAAKQDPDYTEKLSIMVYPMFELLQETGYLSKDNPIVRSIEQNEADSGQAADTRKGE